MRHQITTIGSSMRDMFLYTDAGAVFSNPADILRAELIAFERAAKLEVQKLIIAYGGGAANTAVTFARLGLKPSIITAVGDDAAGLDACIHLRTEGVSLQHVQRISHELTGTAVIISIPEHRSQVALVYRGASAHLRITPIVASRITTPWVYLTALGGSWQQPLKLILHRVRQRGLKLAWNPGSSQIEAGLRALKQYIAMTEVFMVNHDEALDLAKHANLISGNVSPRSLVALLARYGARYTAVTDGHRGAYVRVGRRTIYQKAKLGRTVNKTGAGDAFGSGFVAGLIKFNDVDRALKLAAYNSHAVVGKIGAQSGILQLHDIKRLSI